MISARIILAWNQRAKLKFGNVRMGCKVEHSRTMGRTFYWWRFTRTVLFRQLNLCFVNKMYCISCWHANVISQLDFEVFENNLQIWKSEVNKSLWFFGIVWVSKDGITLQMSIIFRPVLLQVHGRWLANVTSRMIGISQSRVW